MSVAPSKSGLSEPFAAPDPGSRVEVEVEGRVWLLDRAADMEALWDAMDEADLDEDERLPYWAEVWPASVLLGRHILRNADRLSGQKLPGHRLRARPDRHDRGLGRRERGRLRLRVARRALRPAQRGPQQTSPNPCGCSWTGAIPRSGLTGAFDFIWGGDVLYEKRFFDPLIRLFRHALAPNGRIWIGEPVRTVSRPVWERLADEGFATRKLTVEKVALCGQNATVNLWEITIP